MIEMKKYKLGECLSMIQNGATIPQREGAGGLPITRIETLSNDLFNRDRLGYANITDVDKYADYILQDKDILMSHINSRTFLGRAVQYHKNEDETIIHGMNLLRIKANTSILDTDYLYYFFKTPYFKKCVDCKRTDAVNQSSINISNIKDISINLPPLPIQQKVASVLSSLDRKIALNKQINQNLEALARQLYDYWFVQFDFPNEEGKPYKSSGGKMIYNPILKREIPAGWEVKRIGDILDKVQKSTKLTTDEYQLNGKYPIIDQTVGVYYAGFTDRDDAVLNQCPAVVFGDHSCSVKYVNFPFVRGADGTQVMISRDSRISTEYLYFAVKGVRIGKGYARHYSFLKDSLIIAPTKDIASNFKEKAEELFTLITQNKEINLSLTKQRDELLPLLMNGQVNFDLSVKVLVPIQIFGTTFGTRKLFSKKTPQAGSN